MLYAKVVLGLPVDVAFDYSVPLGLQKDICVGARVLVSLRNKKAVGYVAALTRKTYIKNIKDIIELLDKKPILSNKLFLLAKQLSEYYCCSFGEMIGSMLPSEIRNGKLVKVDSLTVENTSNKYLPEKETILLYDLDRKSRWNIYIDELRRTQEAGNSSIALFSDIPTAFKAKDIFEKASIKDVDILFRKEREEFKVWQEISAKENCVVVGTRSAVFAPVNRLGLIILDREEDSVYKQEQVPHYHAREAALMRSQIEGFKVILESASPSLHSFYLSKSNKLTFKVLKAKDSLPRVSIVDLKRRSYAERKSKEILPRIISDAILSVLLNKGKVLVFMNRKGFATYAACHNCGKPLQCPRCNISLVYHFDQDILRCHHCTFKMTPPKICPYCNAGYIKYSGIGTDKVGSELARIFPQAKIGEDIIVSTSLILKDENARFDLVCCLGIDDAINRVDYMAAEKVFYIISGLVALAAKDVFIPTRFPEHHCFKSVLSADPEIFYSRELKLRKQMEFPPYKHIGLVKFRGLDEEKVEKAAHLLFEKLKEGSREVKVLSLHPGQPHKLRGNFYWQILFSALKPQKLTKFLKNYLKDFRYSGIIVTVDIDPI